MGYEIAEQFGWAPPDVILYPTGGGVGLIGIHKALAEMRAMGWLRTDVVPRLVAVQAAGCAPIVEAFERGDTEATAPADPRTVAFGITVPKPLGDFLILRAVRETGGTAVSVTDEELLATQLDLAAAEGTFVCPEGAACFAALARLRESGWLGESERVVVLNTGTGIKYPDTVNTSGTSGGAAVHQV
ncbi:pyridoxal-phosphate dependent enzyme [Actinokineospora sp. PR83]|uniref:pyridoxal-phosphate dependent enzyme n=1 Tax=Actinokineospora sp. PR83 TaxID=2884908 RepID=UPI001F2A39B7|nr:pyridoxal-phosphate dependent enzyme [Actinokineospora sp. PR83]MCG8920812.1 pyridoxal-phosphate dependent enzyme [Actinokineospora sp. PR83]